MSNTSERESQSWRLINRRQLRQLVPVSDMTIWRWIKAGIFPEPIKINGRNYWREDSVYEALAAGVDAPEDRP